MVRGLGRASPPVYAIGRQSFNAIGEPGRWDAHALYEASEIRRAEKNRLEEGVVGSGKAQACASVESVVQCQREAAKWGL